MDGCEECGKHRMTCHECGRPVANEHDEGLHNTGECGCPTARALCWRDWNGNRCLPRSVYDTGPGASWCLGDVGV